MRTKEGNIELFYNTLESSLWSLCSRVDTTHFLLLLISCTFFPPLLVYVLKCQSSFWSELKLIFFMNETRPKKRREFRKVSILWQVQQHTWKSLFHRAVKRLRTSLKTHVNRGEKNYTSDCTRKISATRRNFFHTSPSWRHGFCTENVGWWKIISHG